MVAAPQHTDTPSTRQDDVRRGLSARLSADQTTAVRAHVVAILALGALLWGDVPTTGLVAWIAIVLGAPRARALAARRGAAPPFATLQLRVRLTLTSRS